MLGSAIAPDKEPSKGHLVLVLLQVGLQVVQVVARHQGLQGRAEHRLVVELPLLAGLPPVVRPPRGLLLQLEVLLHQVPLHLVDLLPVVLLLLPVFLLPELGVLLPRVLQGRQQLVLQLRLRLQRLPPDPLQRPFQARQQLDLQLQLRLRLLLPLRLQRLLRLRRLLRLQRLLRPVRHLPQGLQLQLPGLLLQERQLQRLPPVLLDSFRPCLIITIG